MDWIGVGMLVRAQRRVFVAVLTILLILVSGVARVPSAEAADAREFNPGNIISDADFFDSGSMSVSDIQRFLDSKVSVCGNKNAQPCLKQYAAQLPSRASDRYCGPLQGGDALSSAQIVDRVARACGVSQKVLIVLLQKEQGLVTNANPTATMYRSATGYGCPDTAACDAKYYGFGNQLYNAARQFKVYAAHPGIWHYRPNAWNDVLYSPNASCGTKRVFIENIATFALYTYTPYTPNQAALNNLYGTGNGCSAYGNRNFWRDFSDWFGTADSGPLAISRKYDQTGGKSGPLGDSVTSVICVSAGCSQEFQGGTVAWSASGGAHPVFGEMRRKWVSLGAQSGKLGYPVADEVCGGVGCSQEFQDGMTVWSASSGARLMAGATLAYWNANSAADGYLGYPTSDVDCTLVQGGCAQFFQNGVVYGTSSTGMHGIRAAILSVWIGQGWENGRLGYPVAEETCVSARCSQEFQGGKVSVRGDRS